jgi:hypothetical protein
MIENMKAADKLTCPDLVVKKIHDTDQLSILCRYILIPEIVL